MHQGRERARELLDRCCMMNVVRSLGRVQPSRNLLRGRPFVSRDHAAHLQAASGVRSSGAVCRAASDVVQQRTEGQAAAAPKPKVRLGIGFCFWPITTALRAGWAAVLFRLELRSSR